jgi:hypothetical protein
MHMPYADPRLPRLHRGSQRGKSYVVPNYSTLLFVYRFPLFSCSFYSLFNFSKSQIHIEPLICLPALHILWLTRRLQKSTASRPASDLHVK